MPSAIVAPIAGAGGARRSRPQELDRYVSSRIRQRRIMLGITQQQMAELIWCDLSTSPQV